MSWRDWFRWKREAPIATIPDAVAVARNFGPGIQYQQDKSILLRENQGIANAATRAIANRLSTLKIEVVVDRKDSAGTIVTEVIDDHPLAMLLARPHPNYSLRAILRLTTQWIITVGEAYLQKINNGFGVPTQLLPINPQIVSPHVERGQIVGYWITDANGQQYELPPEEMIRIWYPDPRNPWQSEGYIGPSAIILDAHKFAAQHLRSFYQYDATPKVVLESQPGTQKPDDDTRKRFAMDWANSYARRSAGELQGTPRILPPGMVAHELGDGATPSTQGYMEMFRDDLLICVGGVPRSVLGQVVHGDRSSAEVNQWVFDMYAIAPIAQLVEEALTIQLGNAYETPVRLRFEHFISADKQYELGREQQDLEHGVRTINEVREDREIDTVPWGDKPIVKAGIVVFDPNAPPPPMANQPPQEPPPRSERDAHIAVRRAFRGKAA